MPALHSAPEFHVLGRVEPSARTVSHLLVACVSDDPGRTASLGLEALHASALACLSTALALRLPPRAEDGALLVVWPGASEARGEAGGAAGGRSFVANDIIDSLRNRDRNTASTLMVIAHEQFHQLVDQLHSRLPSPYTFPAWLGESLAHCYGLRAMRGACDSPAAREVSARFVDLERPVDHGLLELNRRHLAGQPAAYGLFYSQGATRWHALDVAIVDATQGRKRLDDLIGDLLRTPVPGDGSLLRSFVELLRAAGGDRVELLLAKYVGP